MIFLPQRLSKQLKRMMAVAGLLLALPGLPVGFGFFCLTLLLALDNEVEAILVGMIGLTLTAVTTGTGGTLFWHSLASARGKISGQLSLPPARKLIGTFWLYLTFGLIIFQSRILAGLFFPPTILVAAALSPLFAVTWFGKGYFDRLSYRQSLIAFTGAATVGLFIGCALVMLLAIMTSVLFSGATLDSTIAALMGRANEAQFNPYWSTYLFLQITLIYPFMIEFVKPLITLPLLSHLSRRETFLLGAIAGAGFAALETVILTGIGFQIWGWLLIWQFLSSAVHPLGAGLTTLGWSDVLKGQRGGGVSLLAGFGVAMTMQAIRNMGFLALIGLASDERFANIDPVVGLITLAFCGGLGLVALWAGRSMAQQIELTGNVEPMPGRSNQAMAIWAVACLVTILSVGVVGVQFLLR